MPTPNPGVVFGEPTVAQDSELPWPYYHRSITRNGVVMPMEMIAVELCQFDEVKRLVAVERGHAHG